MDNLVGRTLGLYQVVEQLGAGGMATVYKGYHPAMERYVAIKVLSDPLAHDSTFRARFIREARTIARLEHPSILPLYDYGQANGLHYLVMRYVNGGTLGDLIATSSLTIERAGQLISRIGEALAYAHDQGVIHRDIKPANVLIGQEGNVFLSDFGIAKVVEATLQLTSEGLSLGTPAYMAPEQVHGEGVDARSDIYALGVLLYQLVCGELPFVAETPFSLAFMHIHVQPRPPRQLNPAIPEELERVILRAMAKDPEDRFQTSTDMVRALQAAIAGGSIPAAHTAPLVAAPPSTMTPVALAPTKPRLMQSGLQRTQTAIARARYHRGFWRPLFVLLLLFGLSAGVALFVFPNAFQLYLPRLIGTAPQRAPQTQVYVPKGTFTIKDQEILVPVGRDVAEAYRAAFVQLARQDPTFGPKADIDPNKSPTFIDGPQKVRDEPSGTVYRATMEGLVFVPQE
jgi:tRNA A-37 threonylcarbamoyl transferase component Bud32